VVIILDHNVFNDLPLLIAVPRAAQLLGISGAAAYRLVASDELPVLRLGGRIYVGDLFGAVYAFAVPGN